MAAMQSHFQTIALVSANLFHGVYNFWDTEVVYKDGWLNRPEHTPKDSTLRVVIQREVQEI